ncbi:MAG TPA: penicillin acylase family protein, partial [Marmoricola sp.]|nr:penicillin acylase family protein [Marmoricola sp.]
MRLVGPPMKRRVVAASTALLVSFALAGSNVPAQAVTQAESHPYARPANTPHYRAIIKITQHGIPHIIAKDWGSLGFGAGWAIANEAPCVLGSMMLTERAQRSRWFGPNTPFFDQVSMAGTNLQIDTLMQDIRNRHVVENLLNSPAGPSAR